MQKKYLLLVVFVSVVVALTYKNYSFTSSKTKESSEEIYGLIMAYKQDDAKKALLAMRSLDEVRGKYGDTILHRAAELGTPEIVELTIQKSSSPNVNVLDDSGQTPLMYAVGVHNVPTLKKLLELGADVSIRDKANNQTALDRANYYKERVIDMGVDQAILDDFDQMIRILQQRK